MKENVKITLLCINSLQFILLEEEVLTGTCTVGIQSILTEGKLP